MSKWYSKIAFACLFACFGSMASSCSSANEDDPVEPVQESSKIDIDSSILSNGVVLTSVKGQQNVSFTTNVDWSLTISATSSGYQWCTSSATNGVKGSATVTFSVEENQSYDDRSVSITIKAGTASKTFTLTQKAKGALLLASDKFEISQDGGIIDIEAQSNLTYQVIIPESSKSWITENSSRGLSTYHHSFTISSNEESTQREGEIVFKSDEKTETVKVYQSGGPILVLTQNEYILSDKGETITIELKSNIDYGVELPNVDWIYDAAGSRGMSSHSLTYVISPNETYDSRSAEIIFYDKNSDLRSVVSITQVQKDAIILSAKEITVPASGETIEIKLNTNVEFEIDFQGADWLREITTKGLKEYAINIQIDKNDVESSRSAEVLFKSHNSSVVDKLTITQSPAYVAGTLKNRLHKLYGSELTSLTTLALDCPLNGDDIKFIREMIAKNSGYALTSLDLYNASIVEGGDKYYTYWVSDDKYTSDNVIGDYMFYGTKLTNITLPKDITAISLGAFKSCSSLREIKLPSTLKTIGEYAFGECGELSSIALPESLENIGPRAFYGCKLLNSIVLPEKLKELGEYAFQYCENLTSIEIPTQITEISNGLFSNCSKLSDIVLSNGITKIGDNAFEQCEEIFEFNFPTSVTEIGKAAFSGSGLMNIVIPNTITKIGADAFGYCNFLEKVTLPENLIILPDLIFEHCSSLETISLPSSIQEIGARAFSSSAIKSIKLPEYTYKISQAAFIDCDALKEISVPNTLAYIGQAAFYDCGALETFSTYQPESSISYNIDERTICVQAFENCSVKSVEIPEGIQHIQEQAFYYAYNLTDVVFPSNLQSIGPSAFIYCGALKKIKIPDTVSEIGSKAFYGCALTQANIPESLTVIPEFLFSAGTSQIKSINIPASIIKIETYGLPSAVEKIYCYAKIPPEYTYMGVDPGSVTLYVPEGTVGLYKQTAVWNEINNITDVWE